MSNLHNTLRTVEKLIVWAQDGRRPRSTDYLLNLVHEAILYHYAPRWPDGSLVRSRDMTDAQLIKLITGAMRELSEQHLPPEVDLETVEMAVITFQHSIFAKMHKQCETMEELYEIGNYCWGCFRRRRLDHHHILTRGSHPQNANDPWNILLLCRSCHNRWHDLGAVDFLSEYTFLWPIVDRANKLSEEPKHVERYEEPGPGGSGPDY